MFRIVFFSAVALAHLYVIHRIVLAPSWAAPLEASMFVLGAVGFFSVVLVMLPLSRQGRLSRALYWFENLWLGFVLLLMLSTLGCEALFGLASLLPLDGWMPGKPAEARALGALAIALLAAARGLHGGFKLPDTVRMDIHLDRWPASLDGYRIVQISDLHIGPIHRRRFAEGIAGRVNELAPDLVAVTGDLVDGRVEDIGGEVEPLAAMSARDGVFFITGNHDVYSGADAWVARCRELGWRVLRNERVAIGGDSAGFDLAGIDDAFGAVVNHREGIDRALAGRARDRAVVLLAHRPRAFGRASELEVDLQLSGHTHGGQIWPGGWVVRLRDRWLAGHYRVAESQLYVSRGTGSFGPPYRLGSPTEITELILRSARR